MALRQLLAVLELDKVAARDRIVAVYAEEAGWSFGCPEHRSAVDSVQEALNNHEALTYRPKCEGSSKHEFPEMINELLFRLGVSHGANTDSAPTRDLEAEAALAGCSYSEEQKMTIKTARLEAEVQALRSQHDCQSAGAVAGTAARSTSTGGGAGCKDCARRSAGGTIARNESQDAGANGWTTGSAQCCSTDVVEYPRYRCFFYTTVVTR